MMIKQIENIYVKATVFLLLAVVFTCLVNDAKTFVLYLIIAGGLSVFIKFNLRLIAAFFISYIVFAVVAQLSGAEWFYHDMPEKVDALYLMINLLRAFIYLVPICCGIGVSWLIKRYHNKTL